MAQTVICYSILLARILASELNEFVQNPRISPINWQKHILNRKLLWVAKWNTWWKKWSLNKLQRIYSSVFFWIYTVDQSINWNFLKKKNRTKHICFALFESCGNDGNQATSQSWRALVKAITDTLMSQDMPRGALGAPFLYTSGASTDLKTTEKESIHSADSTHLPHLCENCLSS